MEAKLWSEQHESYQAYIGDECAKQHEVIRGCSIKLIYVNMAGGRNPSNNESQEVSRGSSSEEVMVMVME
ncbi:MAG: hypothetical protein ACLR9T_05950 [Thomasclavelia sp.]|uniref:hypothetical protein n=1 Tax=Thomasclavelia sp. TaxID=3025757 RepID=UPI0039A29CCC